MAELVVDGLEAIQVQQDQAHRLVVAPGMGQGEAQALVEMRAVGQLGQRVVQGHEAHPLLRLAADIDVRQRADHAQGLLLAIALDHGAASQHPIPATHTASHPVLGGELRLAAVQAGLGLAAHARQILGVDQAPELLHGHIGRQRRQTHQLLPAHRAAEPAVRQVPIPDTIARTFYRKSPALLALAQGVGHLLGQGLGALAGMTQHPGQQAQQHAQQHAHAQDIGRVVGAMAGSKSRAGGQLQGPGATAQHQILTRLAITCRRRLHAGLVTALPTGVGTPVKQMAFQQILAVVQRQRERGRQLTVEAGHQLACRHRRQHPGLERLAAGSGRVGQGHTAVDRQRQHKAGLGGQPRSARLRRADMARWPDSCACCSSSRSAGWAARSSCKRAWLRATPGSICITR